MIVESAKLGAIEVRGEEIIYFESGILGFEDVQRYVLLPYGDTSPFQLLQAVDDSDLMFVVTEPRWFRPDYTVTIGKLEAARIDVLEGDEVDALAIVRIGQAPGDITANLLAPLLINQRNKKAMQLVLNDSAYRTRHNLNEEIQRASRLAENGSHSQGASSLRIVS